ncbi:MAG: DnaD domain protein [Lactobacillus sp.]|nr:DnaD domain protein [Lactobacillus sp.]MCH3906282.1 DnaD domain protein [Lactobacillus sp.]MCH3990142.1 DnaD domain protein [Lactobacillus sp.]MCH4069144.1 DnaD domain protein [Lactobacillus sp.]MCI1303869.1 DnaD domain protein [Lactobacillus sp.]
MTAFNQYRLLGFTTISNALLAYYAKLKLTSAEFIVILQLEAFAQRGDTFPSSDRIAANTDFDAGEVSNLLQGLIDKKLLILTEIQDTDGKISNAYSLDPLYEKLDQYLQTHVLRRQDKPLTDNSVLDNDPLSQLVRQFEIEFGRLLSPIEREEIADWLSIDHYDPEIIKLALREAVLAQVYNFKYVDRILLNWQKMNLRTGQEVQTYLSRNQS